MGNPTVNTAPIADKRAAVLSVEGLVGAAGSISIGPVSFALRPGECLGVMGPSGSGKTTLLRTISLFRTPRGGQVTLADRSGDTWLIRSGEHYSATKVAALRQRMVYVAQTTSLWPHMTIEENVALPLRRVLKLAEEVIRTRVAALLDALEVAGLKKRRPWEVSVGEARRVAVARALALEPMVLLLDEIEAGLDSRRAERQMELVRETCAVRHAATVVVTHAPWITARFSDQIVVLSEGKVIVQGATATVLHDPVTSRVRELLMPNGGESMLEQSGGHTISREVGREKG